jgi:hypothetical protein
MICASWVEMAGLQSLQKQASLIVAKSETTLDVPPDWPDSDRFLRK